MSTVQTTALKRLDVRQIMSDGTKDRDAIRRQMSALVARHLDGDGSVDTAVPGLSLHRHTSAMAPASFLYDPSYASIVRGEKRVILGDEVYHYAEGRFVLTAVGLPTVVQILDATEAAPYVSIKQDIDLVLPRELIAEVDQAGYSPVESGPGIAVGPVTHELLNASLRLVELLDRPQDIPILARSIQREICYRMLTGPVGGRLRQAVQIGTQTNRVSTAIR
jgi:hypothetical protein